MAQEQARVLVAKVAQVLVAKAAPAGMAKAVPHGDGDGTTPGWHSGCSTPWAGVSNGTAEARAAASRCSQAIANARDKQRRKHAELFTRSICLEDGLNGFWWWHALVCSRCRGELRALTKCNQLWCCPPRGFQTNLGVSEHSHGIYRSDVQDPQSRGSHRRRSGRDECVWPTCRPGPPCQCG